MILALSLFLNNLTAIYSFSNHISRNEMSSRCRLFDAAYSKPPYSLSLSKLFQKDHVVVVETPVIFTHLNDSPVNEMIPLNWLRFGNNVILETYDDSDHIHTIKKTINEFLRGELRHFIKRFVIEVILNLFPTFEAF